MYVTSYNSDLFSHGKIHYTPAIKTVNTVLVL